MDRRPQDEFQAVANQVLQSSPLQSRASLRLSEKVIRKFDGRS